MDNLRVTFIEVCKPQDEQAGEKPRNPEPVPRICQAQLSHNFILSFEHVIDLGQIIGPGENGTCASSGNKVLLQMGFLT